MGRRTAAGLAMLALALAACSEPAGRSAVDRTEAALTAGATLLPAPALEPAAPDPSPAALPQVDGPAAVLSAGGIVVPVLGRDGDAWKVSTPCGREALVPSATPLPARPIVLDPGHGGYDSGAVGPNGLYESELNLAVSRHAAAALERAGFPTVMTRNADHGMNLVNRAQIALRTQARAFVSIHHNAASWAPSPIPGSEMYHQVASTDSKRLAGLIYEEIVAALRVYEVPWVTSGAGVTWRTRASNGDDWYAMVRQPKGIAAALAELAFISNPAEADLLADPDVQRVEGEAVARGVIRFLTTADEGSGYVEGGNVAPRPRSGTGAPRPDPNDWSGCDDPSL
ncbi:MAG TPA: N-acetylmuramoyl-L-alanine amidase [Acidimicrobiales bacterium]|nr:N-acetylmuramoyl-L-alanine amidase [Acidimicrobiales bacterium]